MSLRNIEVREKLKGDDIIRATVGDFGKWQFKISLLMALVKFPIAWFQMSIVFLAPPTNFWCKKSDKYSNFTDENWVEWITPNIDSLKQHGLNQGYCQIKNFESNLENTTIPCTFGFTYNKSIFVSSITSEWDLVCERQGLMDLSQVILMFGVLLGNIFFGILADKHGRKKILILCLFLQSILGIMASLSPFLWLFMLTRCLLALANGGTMVTSFVICMEVVGGKWRVIVPILYQIPFGIGYALMAALAYFLREWRHFHMVLSIFSGLYISLFWLIPESPRWLLAVGRKEEAMVILQNAAKENRKDLTKIQNVLTDLSNVEQISKNKPNFKALFSQRELSKRSILLCINWAIAGVTFYAFTQYMGHIGQNIFVTVTLGGLIAIPGTVICVFLVKNYGRRYTIVYAHLLTSACLLLILAFPKGTYVFDWPRITLAGLGIIGLSVSIPAMYLFTGELFPTVLRNSGVGFAMMFSRLASMLAPLIISLQNVASFLPLLILGVAAFLQALLVLPLPETRGTILPDTISDLNKREMSSDLENNEYCFEDLNEE